MLLRIHGFLKKKPLLVICTAVAAVLTYSVKLSGYTIGYDTDLFMGDPDYAWFNWREIGRFGLILLKYIFSPRGLNIHMADFTAVFFLIAGTLLWCFYIFEYCGLFSSFGEKGHPENLLLFFPAVLFYITSGVWQEQIYYQLQSAEVMFAVFLCPLTVMALCTGARKNNRPMIITFIVLNTFLLSVYQAVIMMTVAALLIFLYSLKDAEKHRYLKTLVLAVLSSLALYFILSCIFKNLIFRVGDTDFVSANIRIGEGSTNPFFRFAGYIYMLLFANVGVLSSVVDPLIASHAMTGSDAVDYYHGAFQDIACVLYIPAVLLFLCTGISDALRKLRVGILTLSRAVINILITLMIPLSVLAFPLVGAGDIKVRVQFVLPLVAMFLFIFSTDFFYRSWQDKRSRVSAVLMAIVPLIIFYSAFMQGKRVSMLFMSDLRVFENDKMLSSEIDRSLKKVIFENSLPEDTPVLIYGFNEAEFDRTVTHGEFIGRSAFSRNKFEDTGTTGHSIAFMRVLGYRYTPCRNITDNDRKYISGMNVFPSVGSVQYREGKLIVKLSD